MTSVQGSQSVSPIFPQACDALEGAVLGLKAGEVKMAGAELGDFRRRKRMKMG